MLKTTKVEIYESPLLWKPLMGNFWNYGRVKANWSSRICLWLCNQDWTCLSMVGVFYILETRITAVKYKMPKITHEYGLKIPHTIANAWKREHVKIWLI